MGNSAWVGASGWVLGLVMVGAGCSAAGDGLQRERADPTEEFNNPIQMAGDGAGAGTFGNPDRQTAGVAAPLPVAGGNTKVEDDDVCDADTYSAERKRLDIYMVVDDSGSMVPWWPGTLDAINQFFMDPGSAGIGVGVQPPRRDARCRAR